MTKKKCKTVFLRPIGDGDSIVYREDKNGNEIYIETPVFEEYYEAEEWCYEHGYNPVWENSK